MSDAHEKDDREPQVSSPNETSPNEASPSDLEAAPAEASRMPDVAPKSAAVSSSASKDSSSSSASSGTTAGSDVPKELLPPKLHVAAHRWLRDYFLGEDPQFLAALVPFCFLSMLLFTRHPFKTNFIFDEQEALLANPYVRSVTEAHPKFGWLDAFKRDFWGLGPERSIGSYRPIPNLVWRFLWWCGAREHNPFLHHWVNVLFHGVNGALLTLIVWRVTKRKGLAWLAGLFLVASAVLTEAVSGVVGISDVFGTLGCLLALYALTFRMPFMGLFVFLGTLFGLYSKESAMLCVPMVPLFALATAESTFPDKPRRIARTVIAFVAAAGAFVLYVETRRRWFPAPIPADFSVVPKSQQPLTHRAFVAIMHWYAQPTLPKDPLNNPLANADTAHRVAGALRVYTRGLGQVLLPWTLSGDYSSPQEPIPAQLIFPESILGALCMILPAPIAFFLGLRAYREGKKAAPEAPTKLLADSPYRTTTVEVTPAPKLVDLRPLAAVGLVWIVAAYFPVSNIPILLPTVRAERFWYFPVVGTSLLLAIVVTRLDELASAAKNVARQRAIVGIVVAFTLFQCFAARNHANDYTTDLTFWDATRKAVPNSAKAHLNYSVMKGARGDLEARRVSNEEALKLAPEWPMASIYLGDTLCRLHRVNEAWPHYKKGFELAVNDVNLLALGIQCLWDEKFIGPLPKAENGEPDPVEPANRAELRAMGARHPGSWLEWLTNDIIANGEAHKGVDPKYRPRGYNEGPKE
jgi:hypothetical protein